MRKILVSRAEKNTPQQPPPHVDCTSVNSTPPHNTFPRAWARLDGVSTICFTPVHEGELVTAHFEEKCKESDRSPVLSDFLGKCLVEKS